MLVIQRALYSAALRIGLWKPRSRMRQSPRCLGETCIRLLAAGVPLARVLMSYRTLHRSTELISLVWTPGEAVLSLEHMHGAGSSGVWRRSPFYFMIENDLSVLRRKLVGPEALLDFTVLEDLHADGMTDYLALMVKLEARSHEDRSHGNVIVTSWTTTRTYGFADADIAALLRVRQRLGVAAKLAIKNEIAENVVSTYLGPRAGSEVLQGHIQRGDGRTIHAIVWHSDLRGSSALADKMSSSRYIALLNGYFECAAGAVIEAGGEVLNFICDVVLAIFPVVVDTIGVSAAAAMDSALEVRRRLKDVNENLVARGVDLLDFGVGLHVGDVVFGNIGAGSRLAFTTIGSAVNEVARLEEMTKTLDTPILTSGEFKAILDESRAARLHSHGFRKLRGIGAPLDIYSLGS
jgi:adenylate cyclase